MYEARAIVHSGDQSSSTHHLTVLIVSNDFVLIRGEYERWQNDADVTRRMPAGSRCIEGPWSDLVDYGDW